MTRRTPLGLAALALVLGLAACAPSRGSAYDKSMAEAKRAYHAGRFEEAAGHYAEASRAAKVPRDAAYARYEAALAHGRAGDVARSAQELRAIANEQPPSAYAAEASFKAAMHAWSSDPAAGSQELEATALKYPESGVSRVALEHVLRHDDEGGLEKTLAHLDRLAPRVRGNRLEEIVTYERAKRLAELGRTEQARDAFLDVAKRWPYPHGSYFDDSLFRASELEEKLGHYREAVDHLEHLLSFREKSSVLGTYERPRYGPAIQRIAKLYEDKLHDRAKAREALHRIYSEFTTSLQRDDALWREAELWRKDGDHKTACDRLETLASDFPDSRYVPCVVDRCPAIKRPKKSKAPASCHGYLVRERSAEGPAGGG